MHASVRPPAVACSSAIAVNSCIRGHHAAVRYLNWKVIYGANRSTCATAALRLAG